MLALRRLLLHATLVLWAPWALAQVPASPISTSGACSSELVTLRAADGVRLQGIVFRASKPRENALLLIHGYAGNFYEAYFPKFADAAVHAGYDTLALNMRDHDAGPKKYSFTDNQADIAAGVAYLHELGHKRLILLGQSMGTNRVLYYQAASGDKDIAATVLVSGPGDLFEWNVWQFGREKAQATVDEALKLQQGGRQEELMLVDLGPIGKALYTARYLLSLRGPDRLSNPYQNLAKIKNPILIVQGAADKLIPKDVGRRLQMAAPTDSAPLLVSIEGAGHSFENYESVLSDKVVGWLNTVAP
ncbi:MAG TPA: alpha/beta fold hydrolase [Candidatus Sulfotelmatobacter sp.]|nr:alpha/beta fold hydrolase [Candidatus Sulfotelmatobacter sp.]